MRALRLFCNWFVIISTPVWAGPFVLWFVFRDPSLREYVSGRRWILQ